jgi:hypothetical protein
MASGAREPEAQRQSARRQAARHVRLLLSDEFSQRRAERDEPSRASQRPLVAEGESNRRRERAQSATETQERGATEIRVIDAHGGIVDGEAGHLPTA